MRDIYVKTHIKQKIGIPPTRIDPTTPGYYDSGKLAGYSICRIIDVPETVSDYLAIFTFNSCVVLGHTVEFKDLRKGEPVAGIGKAWDPVIEVLA